MRECAQCGLANQSDARFCARCGAGLDVVIESDRSAYNTPVAPGTIFEGKYQVLEEIGRGGMGVVYKGQDLSLGRMVAIKVLPEQFNTDDEVIQRFKKEARAMASLDHPNIVPVYAIGQFRNFHYFVMKFLDGRTVADILEHKRRMGQERFEPREVQRTMIEVCRGLGHAHQRGLVHRDIKPGNIMIAPDGTVTIMDFGIVKEQQGGENLTRTGLVFGTPEYMAPEQAQGHAMPGPTTDLYSLGVVAYEMLSGLPPFRGDTPFSVVIKHIKEPPPPLADRVEGVNRALQDVVFRCLEKRPENRWPTADTLRDALQAVDPDLLDMADDDPAFVLEDAPPTNSRRSGSLPPPAPLPRNVPPPPASRAPAPPPPAAEITSLPAPGQIPGRARPPEPAPSMGGRPLLPVAAPTTRAPFPEPLPEPALVDDRPGHYRTLTTARPGGARRPPSNRNTILAVLVAVVALAGVVLIAFALSRGPADPAGLAPPPADPTTPPLPTAPPTASPTVGGAAPHGEEEVRITITTEPAGATVYAQDGVTVLGVTPHFIRRRRGTEALAVTLRKPGFRTEALSVSFTGDSVYTLALKPDAPASAPP
ncbi:protein kinase [Myxococcota bacterium]|nr:protein kinase [Myxococcota bacterium]